MATGANDVVLTTEGKAKLEEELQYLETEKRDEVGERIRIAREFGDISENSEYDDAKNEQADGATDVEDRHVQVIDLLTDGGHPARHVEGDVVGEGAAADKPHHPGAMVNCIFSHIALPVHVRKDGRH